MRAHLTAVAKSLESLPEQGGQKLKELGLGLGSFTVLRSRGARKASSSSKRSREVSGILLGPTPATGSGGWPGSLLVAAPRARMENKESGCSEDHARAQGGLSR